MTNLEKKCQCAEILQAEVDPFKQKPLRKIYMHLSGCPEDYNTKIYNALPWYKKFFKGNPKHLYDRHKIQINFNKLNK